MNIMHSYISFSLFFLSFVFLDAILAYRSHYFLYIFEVDARLSFMYHIVSFFEMGNVVYGSFVVELSIVDIFFG